MRTTKDRVILLIESIIGKEKADKLFEEEKIVLLNGCLYRLSGSEYEVAMYFNYGESLTNENYEKNSVSVINHFKTKLSDIKNDESLCLQVDMKFSNLTDGVPFAKRKHYYNNNKNIIDLLYKAIPEKRNVILEHVYEEYNGEIKCYTKIRLNNHGSWPEYYFKSNNDTFEGDALFYQSVTDFFAIFYSFYVSPDEIRDNLSSIVENLPEIISEKEFIKRHDPDFLFDEFEPD